MNKNILEMRGISKSFGGVSVLKNIDFDLQVGEVHALVGANGAGKSTLMKIINGILSEYSGEVVMNGENVHFMCPQDAFNHGIAMIHQELDLIPTLNVMSNMFLGREIKSKSLFKHLDFKAMLDETQAVMDSLGFSIEPTALAGSLSAAQQQLLLIARAVSLDAKIIIMDEPTSSLSFQETEKLFSIIDDLKKRGKSVIYISHYFEEIFRVSDRITVLRNGEKIVTENTDACDAKKLVYWMIGNEKQMDKKYLRNVCSDQTILKVSNLTQKKGIVKGASFEVKKGEIIGMAGVVGAGRSELVKMVYGAEPISDGTIELQGRAVKINSPKVAVKNKMAFVPEERKTEGLILKRSIFDNISLVALSHCKAGILRYKNLRRKSDEMISALGLVCNSSFQVITSLSGGNQQKAILGRWLEVAPDILILDQPTRGVDIGAKSEIYELINQLAESGKAIILVSDELEEIINLSDRILVLKKGEIISEIANHERLAKKEEILQLMVG